MDPTSPNGRATMGTRVSFAAPDGRPLEAVRRGAEDAEAGALLFLPHGSWHTAEPLWCTDFPQLAAEAGFFVLSLVPAARQPPTFPHALGDALAALHRLAALRPAGGRLAVAGTGTGATVAAALATCHGGLDAAVLLSGIYDLPALLATPGQPLPVDRVREHLGVRFLAAAADPAASPAYAALTGFPHAYVACGSTGPWPEQSLAMTGALANADVPVTASVFAGDERADSAATAAEVERALGWLGRTLAAPPPRIGDPEHPQARALAG